MHCSGEKGSCCFFVLGIHLLIQLCSAYAWGPEGVSILFSLPPLPVSGFEQSEYLRCVFGLFVRACVKRRSLLVFSYCIVGCSFGSILEIVETFIISYSFFTWNPPSVHPSVHMPCIIYLIRTSISILSASTVLYLHDLLSIGWTSRAAESREVDI